MSLNNLKQASSKWANYRSQHCSSSERTRKTVMNGYSLIWCLCR